MATNTSSTGAAAAVAPAWGALRSPLEYLCCLPLSVSTLPDQVAYSRDVQPAEPTSFGVCPRPITAKFFVRRALETNPRDVFLGDPQSNTTHHPTPRKREGGAGRSKDPTTKHWASKTLIPPRLGQAHFGLGVVVSKGAPELITRRKNSKQGGGGRRGHGITAGLRQASCGG